MYNTHSVVFCCFCLSHKVNLLTSRFALNVYSVGELLCCSGMSRNTGKRQVICFVTQFLNEEFCQFRTCQTVVDGASQPHCRASAALAIWLWSNSCPVIDVPVKQFLWEVLAVLCQKNPVGFRFELNCETLFVMKHQSCGIWTPFSSLLFVLCDFPRLLSSMWETFS